MLGGGRPLAVPNIAEKTAAMLMLWLPGTAGCLAAADILMGRAEPAGRLSMSFPYCSGQLPLSYSAFSTGRPKDDRVREFIPYLSNYMDVPNIPLYPFGFGLSYTSFEYSPVKLSKDTLSEGGSLTAEVTVRNTGDMAGRETVQLYIRDVKGSVVRPMRQLAGFKKISLDAGEEQTVSFEITEDMLKFYDINMNYTAEKGEFILFIGSDSTAENSASFRLV